jgi:hypothetical protein
MTGPPVPARRSGPVLVAVAIGFLAAAAWAAPGAAGPRRPAASSREPAAGRAPASPGIGAIPLPRPCSWLPSAVVDGDPGTGTAKEVVESTGVSIPSPWKPVKGAFGRPATAAEVGAAMVEGPPGVAGPAGGRDPERPGTAPEGVLHGPSPPDRRAS